MVDHYLVLLYLGIQLENNLLELPQRVLKILEILDMPYSLFEIFSGSIIIML